MSGIYAMQRANGDWFAFDDHGRFRVPLFHSSSDAMMARLRNFGMLLFKPVALEGHLLKQLVPVGGGTNVDFCMVNDPFVSLKRGSPVEHAQLTLLMGNPQARQTVPSNGNGVRVPIRSTFPKGGITAAETWEDEGGRYSEIA